jgi:wyosine [tRNA(Phe)-imidazoG37] synthetase (radical SAM superfamily)
MLLGLQRGAVYGPIRSRRLGSSLGINVLPYSVKVCTFNCLYCQYGWSKVCPLRVGERSEWPDVPEVLDELEQELEGIWPEPAYITFSGNGEPTLHPRFPELVDGVIALRDRYLPGAKTAILCNSTMVIAGIIPAETTRENGTVPNPCSVWNRSAPVRRALERLDVRIMKLDCGTDVVFRRYNRPCLKIGIGDIVAGLAKLDGICIQTLLAGGDMGNADSNEVAAWIEAVESIRPLHVQLYTLARGYPSSRIAPLAPGRLIEIRKLLRDRGISADVYY